MHKGNQEEAEEEGINSVGKPSSLSSVVLEKSMSYAARCISWPPKVGLTSTGCTSYARLVLEHTATHQQRQITFLP
jgi:hypothetical protein